MEKCWIGIDPGQTGAIATIVKNADKQLSILVSGCPKDEHECLTVLKGLKDLYELVVQKVVIEQQQSIYGIKGHSGPQSFTLGQNYGMWLTAVAAMGWPLQTVKPAAWKKALGYPAKLQGEKADEAKKRSKQYSVTLARRLYPLAECLLTRKKDHDRAEAILLAHIGKEGIKV